MNASCFGGEKNHLVLMNANCRPNILTVVQKLRIFCLCFSSSALSLVFLSFSTCPTDVCVVLFDSLCVALSNLLSHWTEKQAWNRKRATKCALSPNTNFSIATRAFRALKQIDSIWATEYICHFINFFLQKNTRFSWNFVAFLVFLIT